MRRIIKVSIKIIMNFSGAYLEGDSEYNISTEEDSEYYQLQMSRQNSSSIESAGLHNEYRALPREIERGSFNSEIDYNLSQSSSLQNQRRHHYNSLDTKIELERVRNTVSQQRNPRLNGSKMSQESFNYGQFSKYMEDQYKFTEKLLGDLDKQKNALEEIGESVKGYNKACRYLVKTLKAQEVPLKVLSQRQVQMERTQQSNEIAFSEFATFFKKQNSFNASLLETLDKHNNVLGEIGESANECRKAQQSNEIAFSEFATFFKKQNSFNASLLETLDKHNNVLGEIGESANECRKACQQLTKTVQKLDKKVEAIETNIHE